MELLNVNPRKRGAVRSLNTTGNRAGAGLDTLEPAGLNICSISIYLKHF